MNQTLKLQSIGFAYDQHAVLDDISLTVNQAEIACLLGPSGCGKSTLLRLIAGFEKPATGHIYINTQCVTDTKKYITPQKRQVGMLFQDLALFPHLTVTQNIAFGLQHLSSQQQKQRIDDLLQLCRIEPFKQRYPHQLSGGQCQRVALARAMAPKPQVILLDEPFSSVDSGLQSELVHEVKTMLSADDSTALWVTHSLPEAFAVADQVGVMLNGKLLQWTHPTDLYNNPAHPDVVRFLNHANLITGTVNDNGILNTPIGAFHLTNDTQFHTGQKVQVSVRKNQLAIDSTGSHNAIVASCIYQGGNYAITSTIDGGRSIEFHNQSSLPIGSTISIRVNTNMPTMGFTV